MAAQRPPEFRGRSNESELLDRLLEDARGARSGVLVIRGEAGMGKTALMRHAAERAVWRAGAGDVPGASGIRSATRSAHSSTRGTSTDPRMSAVRPWVQRLGGCAASSPMKNGARASPKMTWTATEITRSGR